MLIIKCNIINKCNIISIYLNRNKCKNVSKIKLINKAFFTDRYALSVSNQIYFFILDKSHNSVKMS